MKTKNVLVTGSNGQLGMCLRDMERKLLSIHNFFFTDVNELDITDGTSVSDFIQKNQIDCIINAAAYTWVDKAESEPELAFRINAEAVGNLAQLCKKNNRFLIHISTDYVFDGTAKTPYKTDTPTHPISIYGKSKLEGEKAIFFEQPSCAIIRTSWLYSKYGHNFLKTIVQLGKENKEIRVVDDQFGSPTNANDLATVIIEMIHQSDKVSKPSVFHYANEGVTTWHGFAEEIMNRAKLPCKVLPISSVHYPTPAKRPAYSVFDLSKIKEFLNIEIPQWKESLIMELEKNNY